LPSEHLEVVECARNHGSYDHRIHVCLGKALQLEKLVKPHRIFVGGPSRIGGDPPAGPNDPIFEESEDEIGVAGVDREKHGLSH
jgi:hypothetical protein